MVSRHEVTAIHETAIHEIALPTQRSWRFGALRPVVSYATDLDDKIKPIQSPDRHFGAVVINESTPDAATSWFFRTEEALQCDGFT
jgi:hypothetical protein